MDGLFPVVRHGIEKRKSQRNVGCSKSTTESIGNADTTSKNKSTCDSNQNELETNQPKATSSSRKKSRSQKSSTKNSNQTDGCILTQWLVNLKSEIDESKKKGKKRSKSKAEDKKPFREKKLKQKGKSLKQSEELAVESETDGAVIRQLSDDTKHVVDGQEPSCSSKKSHIEQPPCKTTPSGNHLPSTTQRPDDNQLATPSTKVSSNDGQSPSCSNQFIIGETRKEPSPKSASFSSCPAIEPTIIPLDSDTLKIKLDGLKKVEDPLKTELHLNHITEIFPVQSVIIPWLIGNMKSKINQRDVCVCSPTGSGKTLIYTIPIIQMLGQTSSVNIRCLVLLPVQELAHQVYKVFKTYCGVTGVRVGLTSGGNITLSQEQSLLVRRLSNGSYESRVDVLITTPGRLVDHLKHTPGFDLRFLHYLVIDEADKLIGKTSNNWYLHLQNHVMTASNFRPIVDNLLPKPRLRKRVMKLLFSATFDNDIEKLSILNLENPKIFIAAPLDSDMGKQFCLPPGIKEFVVQVDPISKPLMLLRLFSEGYRRMLVFTNSTVGAHRLSKLMTLLRTPLKVGELTFEQPWSVRQDILDDFKKGNIQVLVASDRLARGIDVPNIDCVVNYDPPKYTQSYIHRAGRTGRMNQKGTVHTLVSPAQKEAFVKKVNDIGRSSLELVVVKEQTMDENEVVYREAIYELHECLEKEAKEKREKLQEHKKQGVKRKRNPKNKPSKIPKLDNK